MEGDNCAQYVATYSFVIKEKERKQKKMYWSYVIQVFQTEIQDLGRH